MDKMTDQELRQKLGDDYYAPSGLYAKTKALPFLGRVSCNVEEFDAGSWQEIVIDYDLQRDKGQAVLYLRRWPGAL